MASSVAFRSRPPSGSAGGSDTISRLCLAPLAAAPFACGLLLAIGLVPDPLVRHGHRPRARALQGHDQGIGEQRRESGLLEENERLQERVFARARAAGIEGEPMHALDQLDTI